MGRPKIHTEPRVTTAIRLPEPLHARLAAAAEDRELSVNYLVVKAIEDYLPRLVPADQLRLTGHGSVLSSDSVLSDEGLGRAYMVAKTRLGTRRSTTVREIIAAYLGPDNAL